MAWPRITSFLTSLREEKGASLPVGVAGFCWGGLHAIYLTHDRQDTKTASGRSLVDACFVAHPSNLTVPGDIEAIKSNLSIAIGDEDFVMALKQVKQVEQILGTKKDVETQLKIYPGAGHGFSVRASKAVPDSKETKQSEEAEKQAVDWFKKHFKV